MGGFLSHLKAEPNPDILIAEFGPIQGNIYRHGDKIVHGYLGIPYAKAPIGERRFKKPEEADRWSEPMECRQYGPTCPPSGSLGGKLIFPFVKYEEDNCLTLNVFSPQWDSTEFDVRPVMVYIHGGAFEVGSSSGYCDSSLSATLPLKDVIVVTINYRVGALGFLTTGDDICRGNMGLWDQTLALKWVQKYIIAFGGDPNNVTVFGQSAGGASVDLLSLSPHSRDLFHRVIPMSGSAHCDFAVRPSADLANIHRNYAKHFGYSGDDSESLMEWFQSKSVKEYSFSKEFQLTDTSSMFTFSPNMDGDFLPKPLNELRQESPKKDVMIGCTELEGLMMAFGEDANCTPDVAMKKFISKHYGPGTLPNQEEGQRKIYEYYTTNVEKSNEGVMQRILAEYVGDAMFNLGSLESANSHASSGNRVFHYIFDYYNPNGFGDLGQMLPFLACTHGIDLRYILGEGVISKFEPSDEELQMIDQMTTIYSNFAKYGDPKCTEWELYSLDKPGRHFRISYPKSEMRDEYQKGSWRFLQEIRKNHKTYNEIVYGK